MNIRILITTLLASASVATLLAVDNAESQTTNPGAVASTANTTRAVQVEPNPLAAPRIEAAPKVEAAPEAVAAAQASTSQGEQSSPSAEQTDVAQPEPVPAAPLTESQGLAEVPSTIAPPPEAEGTVFDPSNIELTPGQSGRAAWALTGEFFKTNDPTKVSPKDANAVFAPVLSATALQAIWWGTRGETALELARVFGADPSVPNQEVAAGGTPATIAAGALGMMSLKTALGLWFDKANPPREEFVKLLSGRGLASAEAVDWADVKGAVATINRWVAGATGNKVQELFKQGDIKPPVAFALAAAMHFEASWASAFDPAQTQKGDFRLLDGSLKQVAFLSAERSVRHTALPEGGVMIELPFAGGTMRFLALLPGTEGPTALRDLEQKSALELGGWLDALAKGPVSIRLPRFGASGTSDPRPALEALGIKKIFSEKESDFSGASLSEGLRLDAIRVSASLRIDEKGGEASAGVGASVSQKGFDPKATRFDASRPFLFFILGPSGEPLVAGRFASPQ